MSDVRTTTHYPPHPLALGFPRKPQHELQEIKDSFVERVKLGAHPQEFAILLLNGMILDGIHRSRAWLELAEEGACDGYFKNNQPKFEECTDQGMMVAWLRVKSRNLILRQHSADQRAAIFFKLSKSCPELKKAIEDIQTKNKQRQADGTPLDTGAQRGNTSKEFANLAGVGETTMKKIERISKEVPKALNAIVSGELSANKVLRELKEKKKPNEAGAATDVATATNEAQPKPQPRNEATDASPKDATMRHLTVIVEVVSDVSNIRVTIEEAGIPLVEKKNSKHTYFEGKVTLDQRQKFLLKMGLLPIPMKIIVPDSL